MAKAIFISADCWLCVFDLLAPSQLGLGISLISHRFDFYVNEHFKTRKWTLKCIRIGSKIGQNGTKEMEIVNSYDGKPMPIPQIQMPRKVIGFVHIIISFIDQNAIAFLHRFRPIFASYPINLFISTTSDRILALILHNIWPMFGNNIHSMGLSAGIFHRLRKFVPSLLNDCASVRFVLFFGGLFTEFPADDNAMASDGQALAKWLLLHFKTMCRRCSTAVCIMTNLAAKIEAFKAAFASASSPVDFIIVFWFLSFDGYVVPFNLTNEFTREQLALKRINHRLLLIRCPIARDESKWTKWEKEAMGWEFYDQRNRIDIVIYREDQIGDGLLCATPGPSDQQQK